MTASGMPEPRVQPVAAEPVSESTVQRMPSENTSSKRDPLMDCATSTSHAMPETTVAPRPIQAIHCEDRAD